MAVPTGPRPIPPVDTCRVAYSGTIFGLPWAMVFWLKFTASDRLTTDLQGVLTKLAANWVTDFQPKLGTLVIRNKIDATWIGPGETAIRATDVSVSTGTAGTLLADAAACHVVNWRVDKYFRGGHPRSYVPGLLGTDVSNGSTLVAGAMTTYLALATAHRTKTNAITQGAISATQLGTVSFIDDGQWRATPEFWPYLGESIRQVIGTQRRRLVA